MLKVFVVFKTEDGGEVIEDSLKVFKGEEEALEYYRMEMFASSGDIYTNVIMLERTVEGI